MQNSKKCPPNLITFFEDMLNLVFQMGKSEMERKGNFAPSYLSFPVPFRPFQINPAFLSLSEKNGQLSGKGNIAFLSLTCMLNIVSRYFKAYFQTENETIICETTQNFWCQVKKTKKGWVACPVKKSDLKLFSQKF